MLPDFLARHSVILHPLVRNLCAKASTPVSQWSPRLSDADGKAAQSRLQPPIQISLGQRVPRFPPQPSQGESINFSKWCWHVVGISPGSHRSKRLVCQVLSKVQLEVLCTGVSTTSARSGRTSEGVGVVPSQHILHSHLQQSHGTPGTSRSCLPLVDLQLSHKHQQHCDAAFCCHDAALWPLATPVAEGGDSSGLGMSLPGTGHKANLFKE